jgi:hypothetical protein
MVRRCTALADVRGGRYPANRSTITSPRAKGDRRRSGAQRPRGKISGRRWVRQGRWRQRGGLKVAAVKARVLAIAAEALRLIIVAVQPTAHIAWALWRVETDRRRRRARTEASQL